MKTTLIAAAIIIMLSAIAQAGAVPSLVNYQGKLTDPDGIPIEGSNQLEFNIYDLATGGNLEWGPQTFPSVPFEQGYFNVILSEDSNEPTRKITEAFKPGTGDDTGVRYFEIIVNGNVISPRQQILSAPYAVVADAVADGAITGAAIANDTIGIAKLEAYDPDDGDGKLKLTVPVGATKFCDENGENCLSITEILRWNAIVEADPENPVYPDAQPMEPPTPPLKFKLENPDTTTTECKTYNLEPWCGDDDGCTVRVLMQYETIPPTDVRIYDGHVYTKEFDGGVKAYITMSDIFGQSNQGELGLQTGYYVMMNPSLWVWVGDHCHSSCGNCGTANVTYGGDDLYTFTFLVIPTVSATVIVYDR